jgi:hypothetical protein
MARVPCSGSFMCDLIAPDLPGEDRRFYAQLAANTMLTPGARASNALLQEGIDRNNLDSSTLSKVKPVLLRGSAAGAACVTATGATTAVTPRRVDALIQEQGEKVWAETLRL